MFKIAVTTNTKRQRKYQVITYFFIVSGLLLFGLPFFSETTFLGILSNGWIGIYSLLLGISRLFSKEKEFYIIITNALIQWLVVEKIERQVTLTFEEIHWIKQEEDGGISFYLQSSFNQYLSLQKFSAQQQEEVLHQIAQFALLHKIKLVNFSAAAVA